MTRALPLSLVAVLLLGLAPVSAQQDLSMTEPVPVTALAVALTEDGTFVGAHASITVSVATGGSGHVFIDTRPLAGTDMQGSARMAARVASAVTGHSLERHDVFVVVRSSSPIIAGPSAGGILTLAMVVALENANLDEDEEPWAIDPRVMSTGTINPDGTIGPVGGILEKARAARAQGARLFLVPDGQDEVQPIDPATRLPVGEPVDVGDHCREELGITCQEVASIEELVALATGHAFERPEVAPPSTAEYEETLGPLARALIEEAQAYHDVWDRLNASRVPEGARQDILEALSNAQAFDRQAEGHWAEAEFYSAASRAFSASIHGTFARLLLDFHGEGRSLDALEAELEAGREAVREAFGAAGEAEVTGMNTLYTVGSAQVRVTDAQTRLASAWDRFNRTDVVGAIFDLAWAHERAETVHWWLSLSGPFGAGPDLPVPVEELADDLLDLADETLAYAGSVLGLPNGPDRAAAKLADARDDARRGFHAAALIEAAESQVIAALSIEASVGSTSAERINETRARASRAIGEARAQGVEPVLPVALFEFAGAQEDPLLTMEFYRSARVFAGFSQVLTGAERPTESRFVGAWEETNSHETVLGQDAYRSVAVGWFAIGVFATTATGVLIAAFVRRGR